MHCLFQKFNPSSPFGCCVLLEDEAVGSMGRHGKAIPGCSCCNEGVFAFCCLQSSPFRRCKGKFNKKTSFITKLDCFYIIPMLLCIGGHTISDHCSEACIGSNSFHQVNVIQFFTLGMFSDTAPPILLFYLWWGLKNKNKIEIEIPS